MYLARFKQCLSRALNLMKTHVTHILQTATQHVQATKVSGSVLQIRKGNRDNLGIIFCISP